MKHAARTWEALKHAIGGKTRLLSRILNYAENTVYRWQEPRGGLQSGTRNPIDLIEDIYHGCVELGQPREDALAPVYCLNQRLGLIVFPVPDAKGTPSELSKGLLRTIKEFGDVATAAAAALADGKISASEARKIDKEVGELIRQAAAFNNLVQDRVKE